MAPMIAACATTAGLTCSFIGAAIDTPGAIDAALAAAMAPEAGDIILSTGGVSVGGFDLVRSRLEAQGCRILFHGIAMRPGKPLLFALLPDGRPFLGLPGTPLAALVGFRFFVGAAIRRMLALRPEAGVPVTSGSAAKVGVSVFLRGRRSWDKSNRLVVNTALDQRPHILNSLLEADTWIRVDPATSAPPVCLCYPKGIVLK